MSQPKLCLVIPIWQRPALTNHLLTYYHALFVPGIDLEIVVVGSEGDVSRRIARGLNYLEVENEPLDAKYDAGIEFCRRFDPDAVCLVGSDDFITEPYFSWGMEQLHTKYDMVGLLDFYLVDIPTSRVFYWGGYHGSRAGETIAAGRMYSRRLLDRLDWKPYLGPEGHVGCQRDDERALAHVLDVKGAIRAINMAHIGCQYWAVKTGNEFNPTTSFQTYHRIIDITGCSYRSCCASLNCSDIIQ